MKFLLTLLFFATATSLFISCGSIDDLGNVAMTGDIKELYPLAVGNEWVVEVREFNPDGSIVQIDTTHIRIGSTLTIDGHEAFQVYIDDIEKNVLYYDGTTDLFSLNGKSSTILRHALHAPMSVGQSYDLKNSVTIVGADTILNKEILTLTAQHASKTIPAGTFTDSCAVFEDLSLYGKTTAVDTSKLTISYYAPHVGNIYQEDYSWIDGTKYLKYQSTLLSYVIK